MELAKCDLGEAVMADSQRQEGTFSKNELHEKMVRRT
jgi:hypothetical protein